MATTYITRTPASNGSDTKFTFSTWVKRGITSAGQEFLFDYYSGGYDQFYFAFNANDTLAWQSYNGGSGPSNTSGETTRKFRDPGAWYHIVLAVDTTLASSGDRIRLYINGVEETVFNSENQPAQDTALAVNQTTETLYIGAEPPTPSGYFTGEMSHVQWVDGAQLAPTEFGEVDSTSGVWKIKTSCYATPGTNGFCMKMEDRTNLDLDSSSNAHTFVTSGTGLTATYDNPSNNFATMNPLNKMGGSSPTFSNGNNTYLQGGTSQYYPSAGTMGLSAGLWYWEGLYTSGNASLMGIAGDASVGTNMVGTSNNYLGYTSEQWALYTETGVYYTGTTGTSYGVAVATDTIIGFYLDLTANKLYFANNGTIMNSGTGISITAAASTKAGYYVPSASYWGSNTTFKFNFGNGYLGTTAVTSAVADAGGIGAFEFDPSDGGGSSFDGSAKNFRAICTKNIKAYGG